MLIIRPNDMNGFLYSYIIKPFPFCFPQIVVEGNIGSGKSTLLNYFSKKEGIEVFPEPVHKWRDNKGHNILVNKFTRVLFFSFLRMT